MDTSKTEAHGSIIGGIGSNTRTIIPHVSEQVSKNFNRYVPNEWNKLLSEGLTGEELQTAIYTKALKDHFKDYRPDRMPPPPREWNEEYQVYLEADRSEKSAIWREILIRFPGYIKKRDEVNANNRSNKYFLKEMLEHFKKMNLRPHVEKIEQRLLEFEQVGVQ